MRHFLQRDPLGLMQASFNHHHEYAYVGNSPLVRTDASGQIAPLIIVGGIVIAGGGAILSCPVLVYEFIIVDLFFDENGSIRMYCGTCPYDDGYMHCVASCTIAKICGGTTAGVAAIAQEIPPADDWEEDIEADAAGLTCGSGSAFLFGPSRCCQSKGYPPAGNCACFSDGGDDDDDDNDSSYTYWAGFPRCGQS